MDKPAFGIFLRCAWAWVGLALCFATLSGCENVGKAVKDNFKDESTTKTPANKVGPLISALSNATTAQDQAVTVSYTITDADSTLDCQRSIYLNLSNPSLFPPALITRGGSAPNCKLTFQPATGYWGSSTVQIEVTDGTYKANTSFTLTVTEGVTVPTVSSASANEGSNAVFTVSLAQALPGSKTYTYATSDGTATAGTHYTATSGSVTFAAGETEKTISVPTIRDNVHAPSRTFNLVLNAGGTLSSGTGTIVNIDGAPTASANGVSAGEGSTLTFTVNLTRASTSTTTVTYATSDGTAVAGVNYTASSGTLTFAPGETSKTITVSTLDDGVYGPDTSMTLTLTGNGVTRTATGTITDVQGAPTVSAAGVSANEGSNLVFTVNLSHSASSTVTVTYATSNGTAAAGTNYTSTSGSLTFTPGQTSKTVTVPSTADGVYTPNLTFTLALSLNGATTTATGTIVNTDAAPTASAANVSANEGSSITFTVSLDRASSASVSVTYSTTNGTAISGTNYTSSSGILTFTAGQTSKTLTVPTIQDSVYTSDLDFTLSLTAGGTTNTATGTIVNTDTAPTPTITGASANEGSNITFTVALNHASASATTVTYATADGTALAGTNYTAASGTLTFNAGETSKSVVVSTTADSKYSPDLTFTLSATGNGVTKQGTGTIVNTDAAPGVSAGNISANEGSNLVFTVTLDKAATTTTSVTYSTADVTAKAGVNYTAASGTLTFAAGQTSKTITITSLSDSTYNADLTFTLNLTLNSVLVPVTGTIVNTDTVPTVSVSVSSASITEGNPATFTFTLDHASAYDVQVNYATADGTATGGSDYGTSSGTATIHKGTLSSSIHVVTYDDNADEQDETFTMKILSAVNASLGTLTASETIQDTTLFFNFLSGSLPSGLTFARTSSGTYFDSSGVMQTAGAGAARFDYDPSSCAGTCTLKGLLIEEARTNLLLQSGAFDSTWLSNGVTVTADSVASPTGATDADTLVSSGGVVNANSNGVSQSVTLAASTAYSLSFFVKNVNAGTSVYEVSAFNSGTSGKTVTLTWTGGVPTASAGSVQTLRNGWYRVSLPFVTNGSDAGAATVTFYPSTTLLNGSVYLWGAQLEAGSTPTSYIATTNATATRNGDSLSVDSFATWFNATAWTAILDVSRPAYESTSSSATPVLFSACDNSSGITCSADRFEAIHLPSDNTFRGRSYVASANVATSNYTNAASLADTKVQMGVSQSSAGALRTVVNGTAATASAGASKPTLSSFLLGSGGYAGAYSNQINGHLKKFTYRSRALTSAQLQAMTSD